MIMRQEHRQLWRMVALGYAYLLFVFILLTGLVVYSGFREWWLMVIILGISEMFFLIALFTPFEKPMGKFVMKDDSPVLFAELEKLREVLVVPEINEIILTTDFNAGAVEIPKFNFFGPSHRVLSIGLPLLETLNSNLVHAVLAHELAHLSKSHSRSVQPIAHIYGVWENLAEARFGSRILLGAFAQWYLPRFEALAAELIREQEEEADLLAVSATNRSDLCSAKVQMAILTQLVIDPINERMQFLAREESEPPNDFVSRLVEALGASQPESAMLSALRQFLSATARETDSHNSLGDQLRQCGVELSGDLDEDVKTAYELIPAMQKDTARSVFLEGDYRAELDQIWSDFVRKEWAITHHEAQTERRQLEEIEAYLKEATEPDHDALHIRASLIGSIKGQDAAVPFWKELLALDADHPDALIALGMWELEHDEEKGIRMLEQAVEREPSFAKLGRELIAASREESAEKR